MPHQTPTSPQAEPAATPKPGGDRAAKRSGKTGRSAGRLLSQGVLALALATIATEGVMRIQAESAFPHINVYEPDPELGLKLRPGARQRYKLHGDSSSIRINSAGFRGEDWPAPTGKEVLIVGDSQVFGLGVESDESLPAALERSLGQPVLNGGVPTYGPQEYLAVAKKLRDERGLSRLVFVLNFSNDLFELSRANKERHVELDGWALRAETAPKDPLNFPGRHWLFTQSHLVYRLRQALAPEVKPDLGEASEGTWEEVQRFAELTRAQRRVSLDNASEAEKRIEEARREAEGPDTTENRLVEIGYSTGALTEDEQAAVKAVISDLAPGDIVDVSYGESSRAVPVTAEMLRQGAQVRRQLLDRAKKAAKEDPYWKDQVAEIERMVLDREGRLAELHAQTAEVILLADSPWRALFDELRTEFVDKGVPVLVVALPLDVQVVPERFATYGAENRDLSVSRLLLEEAAWTARAVGLEGLDLSPTLANAGVEAFQPGDLHLSPKGYAAAAAAIAAAIEKPPAGPPRDLGLEPGRSRIPSVLEWEKSKENLVKGSSKNHCRTWQIREWLRISCTRDPAGAPPIGAMANAPHPELHLINVPDHLISLLAPLQAGRPLSVAFHWQDRVEDLVVAWNGDVPTIHFEPAADRPRPKPDPADAHLWEAAVAAVGQEQAATLLYGTARKGCAAWSVPDDRLQCSLGTRSPLPYCPSGQVNGGAAGFCAPVCGAEGECAEGVCTDWRGGKVCL